MSESLKTIGEFEEKSFLKTVIAKYARTAAADSLEDGVVIDLADVLATPELPYLVYSLDHPSFIKRLVPEAEQYRFYGRWVAAAICGDVLAMGARPRGFSLDIAAPPDLLLSNLECVLCGVRDVLDAYGTRYEGGNFDANELELVGTAWGLVARRNIIRRQGARLGDYLAVTTTLGFGWADYVSRALGLTDRLSSAARDSFQQFKLLPLAPSESILAAVETGGITSGMDLSDGLVEFLYTIRERNGFGVRVLEDWVPVTPEMDEVALLLGVQPALLCLDAGYDTPLAHAYTVNPAHWEEMQAAFARHGDTLYRIGLVQQEPAITWVARNGKETGIPAFWDDQFRKADVVQCWLDMIRSW